MSTVFVYGTLMAPEVLVALIKRVPDMTPARLPGHRRHRLRGQVFPAAVPSASPSDSIRGLLLSGLQPDEVAVFDLFEGEEYEKQSVSAVKEGEGGGPRSEAAADVYLWTRPHLAADLLPSPPDWDYDGFRSAHLERYAKMAGEFGAEARAAVAGNGWWGGGDGAAARAAELARGVEEEGVGSGPAA